VADANPFADGAIIIVCYGGAKPTDKHCVTLWKIFVP
jgi:hypothetical protein